MVLTQIPNVNIGNTVIGNIQVRASLDNFATFTTLSTIAVPDDNLTRTQTINLTGFNLLQNLITTAAIRLYGYTAEATTGSWRLNSPTVGSGLIVSGEINQSVTASTPEPSNLLGFITLGGSVLSPNGKPFLRLRKVKILVCL